MTLQELIEFSFVENILKELIPGAKYQDGAFTLQKAMTDFYSANHQENVIRLTLNGDEKRIGKYLSILPKAKGNIIVSLTKRVDSRNMPGLEQYNELLKSINDQHKVFVVAVLNGAGSKTKWRNLTNENIHVIEIGYHTALNDLKAFKESLLTEEVI